MLRGIPSITAFVIGLSAAATGCSSASTSGSGEPASVAVQADSTGLACGGGHGGSHGARTVSLYELDTSTMTLYGVTADGAAVAARLAPTTTTLVADLGSFPPDPIFPQCEQDAATYDDVIGGGLTRSVLSAIGALANDGCDASIAIASDGTLASFQPVP